MCGLCTTSQGSRGREPGVKPVATQHVSMLECLTQVAADPLWLCFSNLFVLGFPRSRGGRHSVYKADKQDLSFQSSLASYKDPAEELPDLDNESSWDNSSSTSEINSTTWDSLNEQLRDTILQSLLHLRSVRRSEK